jgi:hypothetical protein
MNVPTAKKFRLFSNFKIGHSPQPITNKTAIIIPFLVKKSKRSRRYTTYILPQKNKKRE